MIKMHSHSKYAIVVLIFILAIVIGIKTSNLFSVLDNSQDLQEGKEISEAFEKYQYYKKLEIVFQTSELRSAMNEIDLLVADPDVILINSEAYKNSFHTFLEVKNSGYEKFYNNLHNIKGFFYENVNNSNLPEYDINIEEHLNNKELAKLQLQTLLQHSIIPERVNQYNQQLDDNQAEIDRLQNMKIALEKYAQNTLISVMVQKKKDQTQMLLSALKKFGINTFAMLFLMIVFFTILYFILDLLLKFMRLIGIKTSSATSSHYNYSSRRKKIKRKYKDHTDVKQDKTTN
jgi:hypothetical protein